MRRRPWFKFHTQDWRADPALRMCSPAARGLWADMLSLMHEAEPYGYLLVGGIAPSEKKLATLLSIPSDLIGSLIGDLEENGVFSRDESGVIFSRRMVRDAETADEAREHIAKRWGKTTKSRGVTSAPNRDPNRGPMSENGADPNTKSQKSESDKVAPLRARATHDVELWKSRLNEATERAGSALNPTDPASKTYTILRNLCEPAAGEPCDWESDVLPAIDVCSARKIAAKDYFGGWGYIERAAIANRDRRLAGLPAPQTVHGASTPRPRTADKFSVIDRVAAEMRAK